MPNDLNPSPLLNFSTTTKQRMPRKIWTDVTFKAAKSMSSSRSSGAKRRIRCGPETRVLVPAATRLPDALAHHRAVLVPRRGGRDVTADAPATPPHPRGGTKAAPLPWRRLPSKLATKQATTPACVHAGVHARLHARRESPKQGTKASSKTRLRQALPPHARHSARVEKRARSAVRTEGGRRSLGGPRCGPTHRFRPCHARARCQPATAARGALHLPDAEPD
mmetsp:Transcript_56829/g.118856  ORF Transcript_56829/g.118856 Transcript_56829/m.118856 type:complete len:222 (-) Transcript_56829:22-687(-)